jgi:hypothetical protein
MHRSANTRSLPYCATSNSEAGPEVRKEAEPGLLPDDPSSGWPDRTDFSTRTLRVAPRFSQRVSGGPSWTMCEPPPAPVRAAKSSICLGAPALPRLAEAARRSPRGSVRDSARGSVVSGARVEVLSCRRGDLNPTSPSTYPKNRVPFNPINGVPTEAEQCLGPSPRDWSNVLNWRYGVNPGGGGTHRATIWSCMDVLTSAKPGSMATFTSSYGSACRS